MYLVLIVMVVIVLVALAVYYVALNMNIKHDRRIWASIPPKAKVVQQRCTYPEHLREAERQACEIFRNIAAEPGANRSLHGEDYDR